MPRSSVVITGVGVVSSIGIGGETFFQSLLQKRSGITSLSNRTDGGPIPNLADCPPGIGIGGPIVDFDAKQFVRPRKALKVMSREIQIAFAASQIAIEHSGLDQVTPASEDGPLKPAAIGTVFGGEMIYGPPPEMADAMRACMRDDGTIDPSQYGNAAMKNVIPLWMLKYLPNMPACHVGISVNAQGPNNSLLLGDVSGPAALIESINCMQRGIADVVISGSCGTRIGATRMNHTGDLPIPEVYQPLQRSSRPFDPQSKGVVGAEGAATVVLETPAQAVSRSAKPLAKLVSYATRFIPSQNMRRRVASSGVDDMNARGSRQAIEASITTAIQDAGITANDIGLVVSHAMGDPVMDQQERAALAATVAGVPVTATIAALGHTGAATGMIDVATAVLALTHRTIPPTASTDTTSKDVGLVDSPQPLQKDHVLVISHTTSGSAIALVLQAA